MDSAIEFHHVSKRFTLYHERVRSLQEVMIQTLNPRSRKTSHEDFWALREVTFSIPRGKTVGLIGSNGSGKSTALKLMAGILQPTSGSIAVRGRISALLELGAGMHMELTGRENVFLNGSLLGLSNAEMADLYPQILEFSELEQFIDMPVKHYSSGMYMRLGFSVAIHVRPDILLLDEVMAVGDQAFQTKCLDRIYEMRKQGVTIVIVNHAVQTLEDMCDELVWLNKGVLRGQGDTHDIAADYMMHIHGASARLSEAVPAGDAVQPPAPENEVSVAPLAEGGPAHDGASANGPGIELPDNAPVPEIVGADKGPEDTLGETAVADEDAGSTDTPQEESESGESQWRWGSYEVEITDVKLRRGESYTTSFFTGDPFTVEIHYDAHVPLTDPMFGIAIHHRNGSHICGPNNQFARVNFGTIEGRGVVYYTIPDFPLLQGAYELSVSIYDKPGIHGYDTHWRAYPFTVHAGGTRERYGLLRVGGQWEHSAGTTRQDAGQVDETRIPAVR